MPTINDQVAAGPDDGTAFGNDTSSTHTIAQHTHRSHPAFLSSRIDAGYVFNGTSIPAGATIDSHVIQLYVIGTGKDDPHFNLHVENTASPDDYNTDTTIRGRNLSSNSVLVQTFGVGTGFWSSPELNTELQEVVDAQGALTGVNVIGLGTTDNQNDMQVRSYDGDSAEAAKLDTTYTEAAGDDWTQPTGPATKDFMQAFMKDVA